MSYIESVLTIAVGYILGRIAYDYLDIYLRKKNNEKIINVNTTK